MKLLTVMSGSVALLFGLVAASPASGAASAGKNVLPFGGAELHGSTVGLDVNAPVVDMAATHTGHGYWLLGEDGGVFSFGDAQFHG